MGNPLIIENLPDFIEPVLEPVLSRATVKRGGMVFIKLGPPTCMPHRAPTWF